MILEFIGYKTIAIFGLLGSAYFFSGYTNYISGMAIGQAFSPYYAMRFHDGGRLLGMLWRWFLGLFESMWNSILDYIGSQTDQAYAYFDANIDPFLKANPTFAIILFMGIGFIIATIILFIILYIFKIVIAWIPVANPKRKSGKAGAAGDVNWEYDPRRRPSEDVLKKMLKTLERSVQKAAAMSGSVPKDADISIRELAARSKDTEYTYRFAVYVMGPVKGTNFDNAFELPLALDQIRRITQIMGQAAEYENLPIDLVMLRAKKGQKSWEVEPSVPAIKGGSSYPIKMIEKVMGKFRNYFIWDGRAKKSNTGYGQRQ